MTSEEVLRIPGIKYLGTLREGTKVCNWKNNILVIHPDCPPMILTKDGFINLVDWGIKL